MTDTKDKTMKRCVKLAIPNCDKINALRRGLTTYDGVIEQLIECYGVAKCAHCERRYLCTIKKK